MSENLLSGPDLDKRKTLKIACLVLSELMFCPRFLNASQQYHNPDEQTKSPIEDIFRESNIFAYTWGSTEQYNLYNIDYVLWGRVPASPKNAKERYKRKLDHAKHSGVRTVLHMGTRTWWKGFIDYVSLTYPAKDFDKLIDEAACRKLDGTAILIPAQRTLMHKGKPAYWFCTNSELFKEYRTQMLQNVVHLDTKGLMVDDPGGTFTAVWAKGGCYCENCRDKFRSYLRNQKDRAKISKQYGIDIETFDLLKYHKQFKQYKPAKRPLRKIILQFQAEMALNTYLELKQIYTQSKRNNVACTANIAPVTRTQYYFVDSLDFFSCEVKLGAKTGSICCEENESRLLFKIADSYRKKAVIMGQGYDHEYIRDNKLPNMMRGWIADAYASGHYFIAPYRLFAVKSGAGKYSNYEPESDTEIAPLFNFIKQNKHLFDGYQNIKPKIAVLFSFETYKTRPHTYKKAIRPFLDKNIPFDLLISGGHYINSKIENETLKAYPKSFLPKGSLYSDTEKQEINKYKNLGGECLTKRDELKTLPEIQTGNHKNIQVLLREKKGGASPRYVVHLLNKDYSPVKDTWQKKKYLRISIPANLLDTKKIHTAIFYRADSLSPKKEGSLTRQNLCFPPVEINFLLQQQFLQLEIPILENWGAVLLT